MKFYIDLNLKLSLIDQTLLMFLTVINNKFVPLSHCHEFYNPFIFHVKKKKKKHRPPLSRESASP